MPIADTLFALPANALPAPAPAAAEGDSVKAGAGAASSAAKDAEMKATGTKQEIKATADKAKKAGKKKS